MGFEILRDLLQLCFQVSQGWNGVVICTLQVAWGLDDVKCSAKHGAGLAGSAQERVAIWGGGEVLLFQRFLTWKVVRSQNPNFSHRGSSLRAKSYFFKGWGPRLGIDSVSQGALRLQERPRSFPANLNTVFKDTYFYTQGLQACFISQPSGDSVWGRGGGCHDAPQKGKIWFRPFWLGVTTLCAEWGFALIWARREGGVQAGRGFIPTPLITSSFPALLWQEQSASGNSWLTQPNTSPSGEKDRAFLLLFQRPSLKDAYLWKQVSVKCIILSASQSTESIFYQSL